MDLLGLKKFQLDLVCQHFFNFRFGKDLWWWWRQTTRLVFGFLKPGLLVFFKLNLFRIGSRMDQGVVKQSLLVLSHLGVVHLASIKRSKKAQLRSS